jgi:HEAT repeat protein
LFRSAETTLAAGRAQPAIAVYEGLRPMSNLPPQVRAGALRGEIIARGPKDVALLKQSLLSPEYELFAVAVRSALEMRQPGPTQALAEMLPQLTGDRERVAIQALGELGGTPAVAALLALTSAGGKATRVAAIQAAIATDHATVVPILVQLLGDADARISSVARDGLAAMANPEAPAAVTALLTSPSEARRAAGIELVGRRRMTSAVPALLQAASDPVASVRAAAFKRLGELGSPSEVPPLLQLLVKSSQPREMELAGEAVSAICVRSGSPSASAAAVIRAFNTAAPAPKATLLSVLGAVGGTEALETVRLALSDPDSEVHKAAIRTLSEWPDATATPILVQVVGAAPDSSERELAFRGLIRMTRESTATNEEKLKVLASAATMAKTAGDKRLVLAGLSDLPSLEALRAVVPYLSEAEVADEASASAVGIAGKLEASLKNDVIPILQQVLQVAKSGPVMEKARAQIERLGRNAAPQR